MPWWMKFRLMAEAGAGDGGADGGSGAGAGHGAGDAGDGGSGAGGAAAGGQGAGDGAKGAGEGTTQATWPDKWRETYAGTDEKKLSRLARYANPAAAFDALIAAQNRISSGEVRSALPKDATAEQVTQWRAENGIPETPDKYDLTFDNGLVIGEDDKPMVDGFLKAAHEAHFTPAQAKQAVKWYFDQQKELQAQASEQFKVTQQQTEDALRATWGNDYRGNVNAIEGMIDAYLPEGDESLRGLVVNGYKTNAGFAKMLAGMALQLNPAGTLIGGGNGGDIGASIDGEIAKIEEVMTKDRPRYNKDEKMQARYRDLLLARERQGKK